VTVKVEKMLGSKGSRKARYQKHHRALTTAESVRIFRGLGQLFGIA
jgi:hypothetical protein